MSLQVWLPLNGNLDNQGLAQGLTITNNGATVNNAGKIGKCYSFTNQTIVVTPSTALKNSFSTQGSLALWVKVSTSHSAYAQAVTFGTVGTAWTNILFGIDINGSGVPIGNTSNGSTQANCSFDTAIKDNQWHHLAFTYNNGVSKGYLDGVLKRTVTSATAPAWTSCTVLAIGGQGGEVFKNGDCINDVRLYSNCLSDEEIKKLSQGLILHYPLNDGYAEATTNYSHPTSVSYWNNSGSSASATVPASPVSAPILARTVTSDTGQVGMSVGTTIINIASTVITASTWVYLSGPQTSGWTVYLRSNKTDGSVGNLKYNGDAEPARWPLNKWIRIWTDPITTAVDATTFYICTYVNTKNEIRAFSGWQIEMKDHPTPYVSDSRDYEATTNLVPSLTPNQYTGWNGHSWTSIGTNSWQLTLSGSNEGGYWNSWGFDLASYIGQKVSFSMIINNMTESGAVWRELSIGQANTGTYPNNVSGGNSEDYVFYSNKTANNKRISWSGTIKSPGRILIEMWANNGTSGSYIRCNVQNIQIELKDHATEYTPNSRNSSLLADISGYQHNAQLVGNGLSVITDTKRYDKSTLFYLGNTHIFYQFPDVPGFASVYTFSWWQKGGYGGCMAMGWENGNILNLFQINPLCWNTGDGAQNPFSGVSNTTIQDGNWHHIVITNDTINAKLYIDGTFKANANPRSITGTKFVINGYSTQNTNYTFSNSATGRLSDVRIYATALSADDVAALYRMGV